MLVEKVWPGHTDPDVTSLIKTAIEALTREPKCKGENLSDIVS